jgi:hypothetical protein
MDGCMSLISLFSYSARLALPGPEEKSLVTSGNPIAAESCHRPYISSRPVNQIDWNAHAYDHVLDNRQPIIEEPASPEPEPETAEIKERAIEDLFFEDPEEIPTIKLNFDEFAQNLKNYMQVNNIEIEDADMSSALVAITPEAASIPTPKLKNISRLRTEHQVYVPSSINPVSLMIIIVPSCFVIFEKFTQDLYLKCYYLTSLFLHGCSYELPDSHPLLEGVSS